MSLFGPDRSRSGRTPSVRAQRWHPLVPIPEEDAYEHIEDHGGLLGVTDQSFMDQLVSASSTPSMPGAMPSPGAVVTLFGRQQGRKVKHTAGGVSALRRAMLPGIPMSVTDITAEGDFSTSNSEVIFDRHMRVPLDEAPLDRVSMGELVFERKVPPHRSDMDVAGDLMPLSGGVDIYGLAALNFYLASAEGRKRFPTEEAKDIASQTHVVRPEGEPWREFLYVGVAAAHPTSNLARSGQSRVALNVFKVARAANVWYGAGSGEDGTIALLNGVSRMYLVWRKVSLEMPSLLDRDEMADEQSFGGQAVHCWQLQPYISTKGYGPPGERSIFVGTSMTVTNTAPSVQSTVAGDARAASGAHPFFPDASRRAHRALSRLPHVVFRCA